MATLIEGNATLELSAKELSALREHFSDGYTDDQESYDSIAVAIGVEL